MLLPSPPLPKEMWVPTKLPVSMVVLTFWTAKHGINCNSSLLSPTPAVYKFTQRPYA